MAVTARFDKFYEEFAPSVPRHYLQALAQRESNSNPDAGAGTNHRGLLQIGRAVLKDFNKARGFPPEPFSALSDPSLNVDAWAVANKMHRRVLVRDGGSSVPTPWQKEAGLILTAMHNSGVGAVSRALKVLVAKGRAITHANLFTAGRKLPSAKDRSLFREAKEVWQRSVVALWKKLEAAAPDLTPTPTGTFPPREQRLPASGEGGGILLLLLILFATKGRR